MVAIIKRFKQRRGTNTKRLLDTPLDGEFFYVKDYTTAGVSPIWVGDGSTAGAVDVFGNTFLKITDAVDTATASKVAKRDTNGNLAGDILGNSATSTKLATARNISLTGDATGTVSFDGSANASIATTVSNATAAGKLSANRTISLTGAVTGTVSTDLSGNVSITTALGTSVAGGVIYQGDYNAETNTPVIPVASTSNKGFSYRVSTARTTVTAAANVPTADLKIGDFLVSNGTSWDKWDNTDPTADEIFTQITEIDGGEL